MSRFWRYLMLAMLFWVVVDFTTAFNPDVRSWIAHMPLIWVFYVGYPALFGMLIYRRGWTDAKLVLAMVAMAFLVEIVFSRNALLYTFPIMLVMIPVALCIYSFITLVPKWIVEGRLKENWKKTALLAVVWVIVSLLSFQTRVNGDLTSGSTTLRGLSLYS